MKEGRGKSHPAFFEVWEKDEKVFISYEDAINNVALGRQVVNDAWRELKKWKSKYEVIVHKVKNRNAPTHKKVEQVIRLIKG